MPWRGPSRKNWDQRNGISGGLTQVHRRRSESATAERESSSKTDTTFLSQTEIPGVGCKRGQRAGESGGAESSCSGRDHCEKRHNGPTEEFQLRCEETYEDWLLWDLTFTLWREIAVTPGRSGWLLKFILPASLSRQEIPLSSAQWLHILLDLTPLLAQNASVLHSEQR